MPVRVVVVGAGVIGLTSALLLAQDKNYDVTIVAKHMPGDYDIDYASPWAGANFLPYAPLITLAGSWEKATFPYLHKLATSEPAAGIHLQRTCVWNRLKDAQGPTGEWTAVLMAANPWYKDVVPDYRPLAKSELPPQVDTGAEFVSVCINTALYLPYLASQCLALGATLKRANLSHILDAKTLHHSGQPADVIVNCTGLGAATLAGVTDSSVLPIRGQIVVVRNEADAMYDISGTDDGPDEIMYIMTRAAGGGTVIGGSYQKGQTDPIPDADLAKRIMTRAVQACPALVANSASKDINGLDVIRHAVGLRPFREGGPMLGTEQVRKGEDVGTVVHCYGHGGFGYQSSYGAALDVKRLVDKETESLSQHR